jgi:hypothetical protein
MKFNSMTRPQLMVMWAAILLMIATLLMPPWISGGGQFGPDAHFSSGGFRGFHFILSDDICGSCKVHVGLLFAEWVMIALLGIGGMLTVGRGRR